ncbi:hypothetical protein LINPERHAP2_LOCUS33011 [Linum perenne]
MVILQERFRAAPIHFPNGAEKELGAQNTAVVFELSIVNMMRFAAPSESLFNQLQFMEIAVKLAGVPIDCRTLAFGRRMQNQIGVVRKVNFFIADSAEGFFIKGLVKLDLVGPRAGRVTARFPEGRAAEAERQILGQKELEATKTNLMENLFGVQGADTSVNWNDLESGEEESLSWVNAINTYGSNEGTIGDILREEEDLEEDDGGIKG